MAMAAEYGFEGEGSTAVLYLRGRFTLARIGEIHDALQGDVAERGTIARIDLSGIERIDTVGAWVVERLVKSTGARVVGASPEAEILIDAVSRADQPVQMRPDVSTPLVRFTEQVGAAVVTIFREFTQLVAFFGEALIASVALLAHPRRIRWAAVVRGFETVGVNALVIIGLMLFLVGIVIAQQGAVQLEQFGLEVFTINLVGRASIRELGLLMTAIMVAGRSGSAFAAQIGTMKLTEEVDAMRTIGVSPMEALVLPRVFATLLLMPLLGFYAAIWAIIGGGVYCWAGLGIPPLTYVQLLQDIIPMTDLWAMLIKAPVFGIIIAITGCYHGMQVKANAEEVGLRTTAAVVQGIFLVIVLDAFFAVFFSSIGWN
jgi:phospholipid/cholesterol/gamma-HCH transport system permease protein